MKSKIVKEFLIFFGIIAICIAAIIEIFKYLDVRPMKDAFSISVETEEKFGKMILSSLKSEYKEITHPIIVDATTKILKRYQEQLPTSPYIHKVIVFKRDEVNAFALPGGYIVVFSELLKISDNPEQAASVIGHELGHIEKRHVIKRLATKIGIDTIAMATGTDHLLVDEVLKQIISTKFDRDQEREADRFAIDIMTKSRINPHHLASFFRKLDEKNGDLTDKLEFISTHPGTKSRIRAALQYKLTIKFKEEKLKINWKRVKASLQ